MCSGDEWIWKFTDMTIIQWPINAHWQITNTILYFTLKLWQLKYEVFTWIQIELQSGSDLCHFHFKIMGDWIRFVYANPDWVSTHSAYQQTLFWCKENVLLSCKENLHSYSRCKSDFQLTSNTWPGMKYCSRML